MRILIVDDNPDDRFILIQELRHVFPEVAIQAAIDANSFQRNLEVDGFELVITDYKLNWSDGLQILRQVKAQHPDCPVIMFTASGNEEIAVEAMKSGLSDYFLKGRHLKRLPIAIRDLLDRRKLQQQFSATCRQLAESQERLRQALNAAKMGTWDWDMLTGLITWGENHQRLFGSETDSFVETYETFLDCIHPDDRNSVIQAIAVATQRKTNYYQEFRICWQDGSVHWIAANAKCFYTENGRPIRLTGVVLDITDRKRIELENLRLYTESQEANRIKDEFFMTLSHELRTPLNSILGWSKLLRRPFDQALMKRAIDTIERNAEHQAQLVEDLLDVSQIIQGKLSLNISPVRLIPLIEGAIATMLLAAEAKSIQIQAFLDPTVGLVLGDANRLQQIFWNLLSNAVKFAQIDSSVEIELTQVNSFAQVQVKDSGTGISSDFLPYVFDYFRQADGSTTRATGGLGLGLAIVRHLVELHGGSITAESAGINQGAVFTVRFPLARQQERLARRYLEAEQSPNFTGTQALIVDRDIDRCEYLILALERAGAIVHQATSVEQALEILIDFKPTLLLSDLDLPKLDQLLQRIHQIEREQRKRITTIALTADEDTDAGYYAATAGFQGHLAKSVQVKTLLRAAKQLLQSANSTLQTTNRPD